MSGIKPGLTGKAEMVVGTNDTAARVGSGRIFVLATPVMINLVEEATLDAFEHLLEDGRQSLGTHLDISHIAATPTGMKVRAEAEVTAVDGRKVTFAVKVFDEVELVGEGTHERVIVTASSFIERINRKSGG